MEQAIKRIKSYFDPYIRISLKVWKTIEEDLRIVRQENKTTIKYSDKSEGELRFILQGAAAKLIPDVDRQICYDILFENDFVADFYSLLTGKPTGVIVKNFEPITYVAINRERLLATYNSSTCAAQVGRIVAEQQIFKLYKKQCFNHGTARARYDRIMEKYPDMIQRTPLGYLASYLDVSPQSLSRIRRGGH